MPQITAKSVRRSFLRRFRAILIAGLVVMVPIGITAWIIIWLFEGVDNILQPLIRLIVGHNITGVGFAVMAVLILIVGAITTNVIGKRFIRWSESLLAKVPITRILYVAIKQVIESFSNPEKTGFMQVVMVEFPRKGMHSVGFVTNEHIDESGKKLVNVFIPTAPNPTTGFLQIVEESEIVHTNLTIEEGLKMVISAGRMAPKEVGDKMARAKAEAEKTTKQDSK